MVVLEEKVSFAIHPYTRPQASWHRYRCFLEPLMQEMETLWKEGIDIVDGFTQPLSNLRAIFFVTIHDYQALFVLLG
jgi:hypothetical protein